MAIATVLLVLSAGMMAGCIGADDGAVETTEADGADDTGSAGHGNASQQAPTLSEHVTHSFTDDPTEVTVDIAPGTVVAEIELFFTGPPDADPIGEQTHVCQPIDEPRIELVDPAGETILENVLTGSTHLSVGNPGCGPVLGQSYDSTVPIAAGTWTISFSGDGIATGHVVLQG